MPTEPTNPKLAVIYCRVSTTRQGEEGSSLETQAESCTLAAKEGGFKIASVVKEVFSGANLFERPKLSLVRADIRACKVNALIIHAIDRLSRNIAHLAIIDEECRKAKCELIFVTEPLDMSAEGKLIGSVRAYMAEVERLKISERTMRGRRAKILSGKPVLNAPPLFGYFNDKDNDCYQVIESQAVTIRRIFQLALEGYGSRGIAKKLNKEAIQSPYDSIWSGAVISKIINNPAYKGIAYANRYGLTEDGRTYKRPQSEWIKLDDGVRPAIVDAITWDKAQELKNGNRKFASRNENNFFLLRGLVYCEQCDLKMYPVNKKDKRQDGRLYTWQQYRCLHKYREVETPCTNSVISARKLDAFVWQQVSGWLESPEEIYEMIDSSFAEYQTKNLDADIESTKMQLAKTERGLQRLITTFRQVDDVLAPHIEREIHLATREKESFESTLRILEAKRGREKAHESSAGELKILCKNISEKINIIPDQEKRNLFLSLKIKVLVNKNDITIKMSPAT